MIVHAGSVSCACAHAKLAQARRGPEAHHPISHHGAYSARCMKSVLHKSPCTIWWLVVTQRRWPPTTCANCHAIGCVGPRVIFMKINSCSECFFVGRLHGDGHALAPPLQRCIRVAAHAVAKPPSRDGRWPHCPWATAPRPYDSWFELMVEVCLCSNGIEM